ncbi:sulfotransferase family 2 domain-containing protein [Methylocystis bryophila]|uniref:Sulfotransferase family protein n=1 Tax=Methylocystis bryophila TaxID=655015 RepID=A0A1W6MU25_9HYPH|nr:sulfotransferase family 2 domain-containing protein [Methylocystis bryophila]ARN81098.1 hypothetical protein B1812_08430 [Methylocystis bryophila]
MNTEAHNDDLAPGRFPLIVFVHVPKTGGSTVINVLDRLSPRGHGNAQVLDNVDIIKTALNADWISGHIPRFHFSAKLAWLPLHHMEGEEAITICRPVEYFSMVREPLSQLISHLNYSFERIANPPEYYGFNQRERMLDLEIISTDFSDPIAIKKILLKHYEQYCVCQSYYILGDDFAHLSDEGVRDRLLSYTYIGTTIDLPILYGQFGFANIHEDFSSVVENRSRPWFKKEIFLSEELRGFIDKILYHEIRLYKFVTELSASYRSRKPSRPAFPIVNPENFNEASYCLTHRDVLQGISEGVLSSGRDHFERFGVAEKRRIAIFPG